MYQKVLSLKVVAVTVAAVVVLLLRWWWLSLLSAAALVSDVLLVRMRLSHAVIQLMVLRRLGSRDAVVVDSAKPQEGRWQLLSPVEAAAAAAAVV